MIIKTELAAQSAGGGDAVKIVGVITETEAAQNQLVRAEAVSPSLVTGVATNNVTLTIRQLRAGSVLATLATLTLGAGTNLAAEAPTYFTPAGTQPVLQQGDVIDVLAHQNGTGLALPAGVVVQFEADFATS